jgi:hypothetical protein
VELCAWDWLLLHAYWQAAWVCYAAQPQLQLR